MSMSLMLEAKSYRSMYAFENHICVVNAKEHLTTNDNGITAMFEQVCVSRPNDQRPILAHLECVGWVEEILELNNGVLNIVVLLCNWVKANYSKSNATVKRNEYGFILVNFGSLILIFDQSFAFPLNVEQVFFF